MSLLPSPLTVLDSVYDGAVKSVKYTNGGPMTRAREMRLLQELRESIDIARFVSVFDGKFNPYLWTRYDIRVIPTRREENNGSVVYTLQYPDKQMVKTVDPDKGPENLLQERGKVSHRRRRRGDSPY